MALVLSLLLVFPLFKYYNDKDTDKVEGLKKQMANYKSEFTMD